MGYESRLYIVRKSHETDYVEEIVKFNCCGMQCGFRDIFSKLFVGDLYADDGNALITVDKYGKKLKYADFPTVIEWLEKETENDDYRRLKPLLSLLKGFDLSQWEDGEMQIVHYGY